MRPARRRDHRGLRPFAPAAALMAVVCLAAGCGEEASSDASEADAETHTEAHAWSYEAVDAWDGTCTTGEEQSPVDLTGATRERLPELALDYTDAPATVADTGHSVQATVDGGGTMTLDGETYTLQQIHVHTPGEHSVDGTAYAAELHLVHEADDGALAVLGLLVEEGAAQPVVDDVLAGTLSSVDVADLLPAGRGTYRYDGSLTTPPCSEGVSWVVLDEPVEWSAEQVADFAERHPGSHRPAQPLHDRVLLHDDR